MRDRLVIRDGDVETAVIAEYEATRRDALRRGIAVGGAVLAATSIPLLLGVRNAFAQSEDDATVLAAAIGLEQIAVVAYDTAAGSGLLDEATTGVAELFRDQEQEHADGLTTALEALGGSAPEPPTADSIEGLSGLRSQEEVANFAIELETMAVAAYYDAHGKLETPELLSAGASIMANEAQHLVLLRQALGRDPSPDAFVTGQ
jgi:rubrerythrin